MTTRTAVARYVATRLPFDRPAALTSAAAWLVAQGRQRQVEYLARDIARELATQGYLWVRVTAARPLTAAVRRQLEATLKAETGAQALEIEAVIDPALIGGIMIETPEAVLDASVRRRLALLIEGATA